MRANMGGFDRAIRLFIGMAALALALIGSFPAVWTTVLCGVAAVAIATVFFRFCPLYTVFGWNTLESAGAARPPLA